MPTTPPSPNAPAAQLGRRAVAIDNAGGTATLTACTISGNTAFTGGGIANAGTLTMVNTIVAGNTAKSKAPDVSGTVTASGSGYNLVGNGTGMKGISKGDSECDLVGPCGPHRSELVALSDNNGTSIETMSLLPGSPALGKGERVTGVNADERGQPVANPPDIGAYQCANVTQLVITGVPASTPADTSFSITVTAKDSQGKTVTSFSGPVTITCNNGETVDYTPSGSILVLGQASIPITLLQPNAKGLTLTVAVGKLTAPAGPIVVNPATPVSFAATVVSFAKGVPPSSQQTAGATFSVAVTAYDANGNACLGFTGPVSLTIGGQGVYGLPGNPKHQTPRSRSRTATRGSISVWRRPVPSSPSWLYGSVTAMNQINDIDVVPAAPVTLYLDPVSAPIYAGRGFPLTAYAEDQFWNVTDAFDLLNSVWTIWASVSGFAKTKLSPEYTPFTQVAGSFGDVQSTITVNNIEQEGIALNVSTASQRVRQQGKYGKIVTVGVDLGPVSSNEFAVTQPPPYGLVIWVPALTPVNSSFPVTITLDDQNGNSIPGTFLVDLSSDDPNQVIWPSSVTINGATTFPMTMGVIDTNHLLAAIAPGVFFISASGQSYAINVCGHGLATTSRTWGFKSWLETTATATRAFSPSRAWKAFSRPPRRSCSRMPRAKSPGRSRARPPREYNVYASLAALANPPSAAPFTLPADVQYLVNQVMNPTPNDVDLLARTFPATYSR